MKKFLLLLLFAPLIAFGQPTPVGGGGLPSQSGNSGKFLTTNGSAASWGTPAGAGNVTAGGTLTSGSLVVGQGTTAVAVTTTGSGVVSALGNAVNSTGGVVTTDGTATLTNKTLTSPTLTTPALGTPSALVLTNATGLVASTGTTATGTPSSSTFLRGDNAWATPAGSGTVTSVSFTGGLISVGTPTSTPAFTVAGTSGGIPYFASSSTWSSSAALAANALVIGGGAGAAPATTTTGTGILTALGINTGSAGAPVLFNGAGGTPSSIVLTNATGTATSLTAGAVTNGVTAASNASGSGVIWQSGGSDKSAVASNTIGTVAVTTANVTTLNMLAALQLFSDPAPATSAAGALAFDSNAWASGRGAGQLYDGTANTYVVAALASDTPTNGQVPTWNTGGTVTWETPSAGGASALSAITAASASNTIASGNNTGQIWNWANTTDSTTAFTFGETTAATNGTSTSGVPNQVGLKLTTLASSTMSPLSVYSRATHVFSVSPLNPQIFANSGSATNPTYGFTAASNSGVYYDGSSVSVTNSGSQKAAFGTIAKFAPSAASTLPDSFAYVASFAETNGTTIPQFGVYYNDGATTTGSSIVGRKARGSVVSPTTIVTLDELFTLSARGYVGSTGGYVESAKLLFVSAGTIANNSTGIGGTVSLQTRISGGSLVERLGVNAAGDVVTSGAIELGNASDTTISRSSAGVIAVEGVVVPSISSTNTLTNKRVTTRSGTTASSATPTINTDNVDLYVITALAADITSMTTNLSGTPVDGDQLEVRVTGTAARAVAWGASFASGIATLPTTTTTTKTLCTYLEYDGVQTKWMCQSTGSYP